MSIKEELKDIRFGEVYKKLDSLSVIRVHGEDARSFLQNQLTSDVFSLIDQAFQHSAILDNKGRLVSCFYLLQSSQNDFFILVKENYLKSTLERLNQYLISEDVECEKEERVFYGVLGLISKMDGFVGRLYNEDCLLTLNLPPNIKEISSSLFELLKFSSGEPELGKEVQAGELMSNSYLIHTALAQNKGCYPGQETISKILNNKGAAKYPVCLLTQEALSEKEVIVDGKKIGEILKTFEIEKKFYHYALVSRQYRVDKMLFKAQGREFEVHYFPLFKNLREDKVEDLFYLAIDSFQQDDINSAITKLELCIKLDETYEDAYESLGVIYGRIGKNKKAIELMQKLSELNPKSVMAHTNLSLYYMKEGEIQLAEEHKSLATVKQFEVLGEEAQQKREQEEREELKKQEEVRKEGMFHQVLEIDPDDALANYGLGEIAYSRKEYLSSEQYLQQAIKSDPKYSVAYLALARTLRDSGKLEKLKEILEKGIAISTENGDMMPANEMQSIYNETF